MLLDKALEFSCMKQFARLRAPFAICRSIGNFPQFGVSALLQIVDGRALFFANFKNGEEGLLRNIDFADALHALFTFLLLLEQLAFARDITTVTLGDYIFAHGSDRLARDDLGTNGGLDGDLEHLSRN